MERASPFVMEIFRIVTACGLALLVGVIMAAIDRVRERRLASPAPLRLRAVRRSAGPGGRPVRLAPPKDRAA